MSWRSTVASKGECIVPLPSRPPGRSGLVVRVPLPSETSVFLSGRSESTELPVLVNRFANPIDPWVITDCIVGRINQDNLKVFVCRILEEWKCKAPK